MTGFAVNLKRSANPVRSDREQARRSGSPSIGLQLVARASDNLFSVGLGRIALGIR